MEIQGRERAKRFVFRRFIALKPYIILLKRSISGPLFIVFRLYFHAKKLTLEVV